MKRLWGRVLTVFNYLLASLMLYAGVVQFLAGPALQVPGPLDFIYTTNTGVFITAVVVFAAGALLLYGLIRRNARVIGWGLMAVYSCFLFAAILNGVAYLGDPQYWVSNLIMALVTGALWLHWRISTGYIQLKHKQKHKH